MSSPDTAPRIDQRGVEAVWRQCVDRRGGGDCHRGAARSAPGIVELGDVGPEVRIVEHAPGEPSVEAAERADVGARRVLALTAASTLDGRFAG